jgi:hypothetical protein
MKNIDIYRYIHIKMFSSEIYHNLQTARKQKPPSRGALSGNYDISHSWTFSPHHITKWTKIRKAFIPVSQAFLPSALSNIRSKMDPAAAPNTHMMAKRSLSIPRKSIGLHGVDPKHYCLKAWFQLHHYHAYGKLSDSQPNDKIT